MVSLWTLSLLLLVSRVSQGQSPSLFIPSLSHLLLRLLVFFYILVVSSICLHFHPLLFYQNSPTAFQVRCHRRRLNLALVFLCWLCYMHFYLHGASDAWVLAVIVCLSVCLSVTRRHCIERAKRRITQTTPRDSPGTVFFLPPRVGGGRPFRLKFAFKGTPPPFEHHNFDQYLLIAPQPWELAKKTSISTNRKSTMRFQTRSTVFTDEPCKFISTWHVHDP